MIKPEESLQGAGEQPAATTAGAGKPWSDFDDAALRKGLRQAMAPVEIAGALGRTTEEVFRRLATLADAYQHESAKGAERVWRRNPRRSDKR
jgi:hypothetical protein